MWTAQREDLTSPRGQRYVLALDARPASFAEVIAGWRTDATFRSFFNALLADSPALAYRWETPAVTERRLGQPFEFVLIDSPSLAREPDPAAFAEHFGRDADNVVSFSNLRGDAILVVPTPLVEPTAYVHLASFVRSAPETQRQALWRSVGETMAKRVGDKPVWLSTAGAGVAWLHVRLDDRPKYYGFSLYRASLIQGS